MENVSETSTSSNTRPNLTRLSDTTENVSERKKDTSERDEAASVTDAPSIVRPSTPDQEARTPAGGQRPLTKLESALDAARRGFRVHPLAPNTKKAVLKDWPYRASRDAEEIKIWWEENPDYNIGVVLDGMAVVDIDTRKSTLEQRDAWIVKYLPEENKSLTVKTWSNGRHVFYQLPHGLKLSSQNDAFMDGIDLKTGSGAYVVGAGSTIDGKSYEWVNLPDGNQRPIIILPGALIECLQERKKYKTAQRAANAGERLIEEDDEAERLASEWLVNHAPHGEAGNRDNTAFQVAARLYDFGLSKQTVYSMMAVTWNEGMCSPPLDGDEIERIADSAGRNRQNPIGKDHPEVIASEWEPEELDERDRALSQRVASVPSAEHSSEKGCARKPLKLAPFKPVAPSEIPPREWLIHGMLCRRNISFLAGPPGVSKTTLLLMVALALATEREEILGMPVIKRSRVSFWNQEDPIDELQRRIAAICKAFGIRDEELFDENGKPMLYLNSGVDEPFFLATAGERQQVQRGPSVDAMIAEIKANKIDALILDPMVEFHETEESDNGRMRRVMGFAREIMIATGCACHIGTHTRKPDKASSKSYAGDMDVLRGASSQVGAARIVHTLFQASEDDAKKWRMEGPHYEYVRLDMAKNNLGKRWSEPRWFRLGEEKVGEEPMGVLKPAALGVVQDDRADILAEAMRTTGLDEAKAKDVIAGLPEHRKKLFGKNPAHWAKEAQKAFVGPPEHESKWGVLTWSCAGERSPMWLHLKPAPTAH
jgi:AAA domain/Bifunctional DNA primase/polymerase, N-terminal/Primase C terminal 1 (PriCT-1)